jgi:hypothetical protein
LFLRLGVCIPHNFNHTDEIYDAVVQSWLRGDLRFYKLPKIEKLKLSLEVKAWVSVW